jgi:uracil-DNA glycosylase family protein
VDTQTTAAEWVPERPSLTGIRRAAAACRGCELWEDATQVVVSTGPRSAGLMVVGEQPGDQEDRAGEPFVGPAGRLLDRALADAGIDRDEIYLTNAVKHFRHVDRGKRRLHQKPELRHLVSCRPWLEAELAVVRPDVVVVLGASAARSLLGRPAKIGAERGRVLDEPEGMRTVITTHPSALLRIRERAERATAYDALVADLGTAASALA